MREMGDERGRALDNREAIMVREVVVVQQIQDKKK